MTITPVAVDIELAKAAPGNVRSGGLHMSAIYNDLYKALEPERFGGTGGPDPIKLELGMALEEALERAVCERLNAERPGEFVTEEGIVYSPDMLIFSDVTRLGEMKLTWMSSREVPREPGNQFPAKFDKWFTQMKSYCYHLETPYARLMSFFVNGTYDRKNHSGPELLGWDIEFTTRELKENWSMMRNHARHVGLLP